MFHVSPTVLLTGLIVSLAPTVVLLRHVSPGRLRSIAVQAAKPALIHAAETAIDKLPDGLSLTALKAEATHAVMLSLHRQLGGSPLLSGIGMLLTELVHAELERIPPTVPTEQIKAKVSAAAVTAIQKAGL